MLFIWIFVSDERQLGIYAGWVYIGRSSAPRAWEKYSFFLENENKTNLWLFFTQTPFLPQKKTTENAFRFVGLRIFALFLDARGRERPSLFVCLSVGCSRYIRLLFFYCFWVKRKCVKSWIFIHFFPTQLLSLLLLFWFSFGLPRCVFSFVLFLCLCCRPCFSILFLVFDCFSGLMFY